MQINTDREHKYKDFAAPLLSCMCKNKPLIDAYIYQIHLEHMLKGALMTTDRCIYYTYKSNQVLISNKI